MVSTSKILTVSYGTFSCTLEGFDDSFETMKAIAEYFRDLAAEDRYFGAEPPTPDAEMLARIAEREIARRVEAREERGSIVLRASPYGAVAAPLAQPPVDQPAAAQPVAPQPPVAAEAPAPVAAQAPQPQPAPIAPAAPETIVADHIAEEAWEDAPAPHPTPVPHPDPDSVAAKLQRIRDVVTKSAAATAPVAETYSEDEHADSFLTEAADSIETVLALDDQAGMEADDSDDEIAALLSRLAGETGDEAPAQEAVAEEVVEDEIAEDEDEITEDEAEIAEAAPAEAEADLDDSDDEDEDAYEDAPLPARVMKIKRADFDAALADGQLIPETDEADAADHLPGQPHAAAEDWSGSDMGDGAAAQTGLSPQDEAELQRELAEVEAELVDIYRDTQDHAETAAADGFDDEEDEQDIASIFDEDEDEDGDDADYAEDDEDDAGDDHAPLVLRDPRERLSQVKAEDDMSRLMARVETAMTEPESASRRNAIAHLRAAVAATKAEQDVGGATRRDPSSSAFRDDLANVVRPRRPVGEAAASTPRPAEQRPAPLKLVAEQRVDVQVQPPQAQVRPRRVSLASLPDPVETAAAPSEATPPAEAGGFVAFSRKMGATALPDLIEAAAAYLVHVEGREEFSRPQLMSKARQAAESTVSREDGLRAFGQLLRQGKIQKIRGGRFTASEDIGFKPAARRVG